MRIGIVLDIEENALQGRTPTFRELQALAQAAEQADIDSLWLEDHLIFRFPKKEEQGVWELFTMLSALAAVTTRIALGSLVVCSSFRDPALHAKMADTLDEISGGRFIFGLGAGWHQPEYEAFGYPFDHLASRFEEALKIIVPLLHDGQVDFQGQYYQARNCVLRPRGPSPHGPSILIGARRPRMLQLTAQYADAWNTAWHMEPSVVQERHKELKEACAVVGRDPATLELTVGTAVRLSPSAGNTLFEKAITGSPQEIADQLQSFADVGVGHLIVVLEPFSMEGIEQFGRIVELLR